MKFPIFILSALITSLLLMSAANGQSLEDLRKLEELKKQFEQSGQVLPTVPAQPETSAAKSLETFKEEVSTPKIETPQQAPKTEPTEKKEEPTASPLPMFGFDVFENAKIDFSPEVYGPVDDDYPLGPGDQIVVTVWGEVQLRYELTINREGQIYIDKVGLVDLTGLSLKKARKKLTRIMGQSYSSILKGKAFLDVSVGKLRSIRLFVVGEVKAPGVFTVPALTAPFNMLFYAGGVNASGSLRDIRLIRQDKLVKRLDFYEFLLHGREFHDVRLQTHDVLVVPAAKKRVSLSGSVTHPAIYELKDGEGLRKLIEFSGGFLPTAYLEAIRVERLVNNKERKQYSVNYRQLIAENTDFPLKDGDKVHVYPLDRDLKNYVTIVGPVFGPKEFSYQPGMTIKQLFAQVDSISGDAFLDRVQITRTLPDKKKQLFSINLKDILQSEEQDFLLAPEDRIVISSSLTLFPPDSVAIFGAVNEPGKYLLKKDMTLKDLIFMAGGFRKDALIEEAEVSRINPKAYGANQIATILYVPIDSNYTKDIAADKGETFFLEPNDNVFIRANSDWELQRNVTVLGEVEKPGTYTLKSKTERITDLIARAGGLKETAYLKGAKIIRRQENVGQIGIDFERIFRNPQVEENIYLRAGDKIVIPEKMATVKIVGGVHFPSSVLFEKGKGLNYYIKAAGGYTELADKDNVTIRLANGRPIQPRQFLFWKYLPEDITAGSTIYVPVLTEKKEIDWSGAIRDAAAILSSMATVILIYDRLRNN